MKGGGGYRRSNSGEEKIEKIDIDDIVKISSELQKKLRYLYCIESELLRSGKSFHKRKPK